MWDVDSARRIFVAEESVTRLLHKTAILPVQFTTPLLEEPFPHPPLLPPIRLCDNHPHITLGERIPYSEFIGSSANFMATQTSSPAPDSDFRRKTGCGCGSSRSFESPVRRIWMAWMRLLNPSTGPLLIGCRNHVTRLSKCRLSIRPTLMIGGKREREAQLCQLLKKARAVYAPGCSQKSRNKSLKAARLQFAMFGAPQTSPPSPGKDFLLRQPQVAAAGESFIAGLFQGLVLGPANFVDRFTQMLVNVKAIMHDFGAGNMLEAARHERRPHVHRHRLDLAFLLAGQRIPQGIGRRPSCPRRLPTRDGRPNRRAPTRNSAPCRSSSHRCPRARDAVRLANFQPAGDRRTHQVVSRAPLSPNSCRPCSTLADACSTRIAGKPETSK